MTLRPIRRPAGALAVAALLLAGAAPVRAQFTNRWLSAGSFQHWYSSIGGEKEEGFQAFQQFGARWPGIYPYTDLQAANGFWIGARNVQTPEGQTYSARVVHVGPRVSGSGEFFPTKFEVVSRFEMPTVFVGGEASEPEAAMVVDRVDPAMKADAMIVNEVNTLLGLTVQRRIMQFSQGFHDNYHVIEYTFTNTGNTDGDAEIEAPGKTLTDVVVFPQWRWSVARETRYLVGNPTGWGKNAMVDFRGDGLGAVYGDLPDENFRAAFAWHGYFPDKALTYNNIGGPILREGVPAVQIAASDTLGRLGASQFVGAVVLHADTSPTNPADDPTQPRTMTYFDSDERFLSANDAFTEAKMQAEYAIMTTDATDRQAFRVAGSTARADLLRQTADPAFGKSGGTSAAMGFGPYTLAPGQSVKVVLAYGAAGLSREMNEAVGRAYKAARASDTAPLTVNGVTKTKNEWVFTGRDSLFQTFRRAIANYASNYAIPRAPLPPSELNVTSGGDKVLVEWSTFPSESPDAWEVYRARIDYDEAYERVASLPGTARSYEDRTALRGVAQYYYVVAVKTSGNDGAGGTPAGRPLRSSRYYAQTYTQAALLAPEGSVLNQIRVVPNPLYFGGSNDRNGGFVRFPDFQDKISFRGLPGACRIDIYTELGEQLATLENTSGSGSIDWNLATKYGQPVVSGVYVAVITATRDYDSDEPGRDGTFRNGDQVIRKFVIIR